jgi:hypothetical protein
VGIRRRPADPRRPDRLEPIARLAAVHLAESGPNGVGFVQLCFQGEDPTRISFWVAGSSRSTILFHPQQQAQFVSAREWLEYYVGLARRA